MDTSTYFDFIPDELIILIFTYTRSNIIINNRINNLYYKFIDNIKNGSIDPDDVFDSTSDIDDAKKDLLYNIKMLKSWALYSVDCYLQLNNSDTFLDRTSPKIDASYEELSELMNKMAMTMTKIYLSIDTNIKYEVTRHLIFKNEESFVYVSIKYNSLIWIGSVIMKTEKNWKKFCTEILNAKLRKSLFLENRYII